MICCIPSKGRPNTKTHKLFQSAGIEVFHFVEPQEYADYKVPFAVDIQQSNQGVSYVRNFILDWATENNHEWIIICDDDVDHFGYYKNGNFKTDASVWVEIIEKAKKLPFEVVGINYRQHAWHEKKSVAINKKFAEVCAAFNVKKISWRYKPDTKEDRDFALQTIKNGSGVLVFCKYFFNAPNVGSNSGGLHDLYKSKRDALWAKKMVQDWHPFAKLTKKADRVDASVDIKGFAKSCGKVVK